MNASPATSPITLVTGGSRGLGRAAARSLARDGHDIVLTYLSNRDAARSTMAEVEALGRRAVALQLDTGDVRRFPRFVDELREALVGWQADAVDALVNNAGIG